MGVCRVFWLLALGGAASAMAIDAESSGPSNLRVTVYRAPYRTDGRFDLNNLRGFALISEMRTVHLPVGESRVRFEGVADGIESASALISGLPASVIEKNRDAQLLSPSALVAQTVGKQVQLVRSNPQTGRIERRVGTLISDSEGVMFKTDQGIEALRCSGFPETFEFDPVAGLSAHPTLSVLLRSPTSITQQVTLSYLARGFDWSADYTATLSADGKSFDLGAWVTLANSNGVGFPSARAQVVAGRVNHQTDQLDPFEFGGPMMAQCWPRGRTSAAPLILAAFAPTAGETEERMMTAAMHMGKSVAAAQLEPEQLGDLKLYRLPAPTTVDSRQSKQIRLLDKTAVPVSIVYGADLDGQHGGDLLAYRLLRTNNTTENHLGVPLPSGAVAIYSGFGDQKQLESTAALRDIAVGEKVEINMGRAPDVQVSSVVEKTHVDSTRALLMRVAISNVRASPIRFELRLRLASGIRVVGSDHKMAIQDGRPIFYLSIPAGRTEVLRFRSTMTR